MAEGKAPSEAMGIVISYSIRVKLNCGTLGGELVTDVPFKLLHPAPGEILTFILIFIQETVLSNYLQKQVIDIKEHFIIIFTNI